MRRECHTVSHFFLIQIHSWLNKWEKKLTGWINKLLKVFKKQKKAIVLPRPIDFDVDFSLEMKLCPWLSQKQWFCNSSWNKVGDEYFIKVVNPTKPQIFYCFHLYIQIFPPNWQFIITYWNNCKFMTCDKLKACRGSTRLSIYRMDGKCDVKVVQKKKNLTVTFHWCCISLMFTWEVVKH